MDKEVLYDKPRIVLYHNVFTLDECSTINSTTPQEKFFPAQGFDFKTNTGVQTDFRSNSTYVDNEYRLASLQQRLTKLIEEELVGNSSYEKGCIETPLQIQRYAVGQQYKPHIDFFNVAGRSKTFEVDRIASAIVYLNDDFKGGETFFTTLSIDVKPKAGSVLFFKYDYNDMTVNMNTYHSGMPVISGVKSIVTAFVRGEAGSHKWHPILR